MPIYMKYEGIKQGGVTGKGEHNGWIELQSAQMVVGRRIGSSGRGASTREPATPSISEIVVTKSMDNASNELFTEALNGKGKKVTIDFVRVENGKEVTYMSIELENTLISGYSIGGSGGDSHDKPTETLALNFTKITYSTKPTVSDPPGKSNRVTLDAGGVQ